MNTIKYTLITCALLTVTACTSVTVIPQTGGMQTVIANGPSEEQAVKLAMDKTNRICQLQEKTIIKVIDLETNYMGDDQDQKMLVNAAKKVLPANKTYGEFYPENYNYKTVVTFRCIPKPKC